MKWRSKWEGRAECLGVGSALLSEADGEVRGCQEPGRFPLLTSSLPSPRWGCGPLTLQVVRLNLIQCVTVQFCQLFSCTPFPSELLLRIPRAGMLRRSTQKMLVHIDSFCYYELGNTADITHLRTLYPDLEVKH